MLNGWHVRWVCWPCKNWDVFSFLELCTNPFNMGPCIIMLQHEVMVVDEWHNNGISGSQDLVTVSLCIQNAINKVHLCSLSITYTCPYHNPTADMGHSIHNVDISKPLTHTTPYTLSAICPVQWKPGFICEENTSPKCQTPSNVSICPLGYDDKLQSGRDPDEDDKHADELPWDGFWQFVKKFFGYANRLLQQLSWRWRCWMWKYWAGVIIRGLRLWGRLDVLPNSLKRLWRWLMVEKWLFNSWATALVDIPAVSMPITRSLKTCNICSIVLCDKTAHSRVAFYCGQPVQ